jgi:quercetin dioxygenase-like cupin family protein
VSHPAAAAADDTSGSGGFDLSSTYVHLGLGATTTPLPDFSWDAEAMERYEAAHRGDGDEGRLVLIGFSSNDWTVWERHPAGEELVVLLTGDATLIQQIDGTERRARLGPGSAVVNPRGVWHTADIHAPCRFLYVTPGRGTEHRPR